LRYHTLLLATVFFSKLLLAQPHQYHYKLLLDTNNHQLEGSVEIAFTNNSTDTLNELFLHLPPRSQQWKKSFLNRQLIEFQKTDAFFSDSTENGWIRVDSLKVDQEKYNPCHRCEFVSLPLKEPLKPGNKNTIELKFTIALSSVSYSGSGYSNGTYRIIDWLPRMAPLSKDGFRLYPVTFYRDFYQNADEFQIELNLPANLTVASNARLTDKAELQRLNSLKENPFQKTEIKKGIKTVTFEHTGVNLQFIISKKLNLFPLSDNVTLFTEETSPYLAVAAKKMLVKVESFFDEEIGKRENTTYNLVILKEKNTEYQSDKMLILEKPETDFELARNLAHAYAEMLFRYRLNPDGIEHVWLARGIPYYYKYRFIELEYPEERWLPFSNSFIGRFFGLDQFGYSYQNQFLFQFLARQGLDQKISAPADSLTRLNYEAIAQAKTFLALNHFREYLGDYDFKRSISRYYNSSQAQSPTPTNLKQSFDYYVSKETDWFFKDWVKSYGKYDYQLLNTDYCPTVATATVKNAGDLNIPYSLTGFKNGEPVLTEWHQGHAGKKSVQMYHDKYDKVVINHYQNIPEYNQKDNTLRTKGLFKKVEPLSLKFYGTLDDPDRTQVFWMPTANYNAYDRLLLGVTFYNENAIQKPLEYIIGPEYSTGTDKITGYGSLQFNSITSSSDWFRRISVGLYTRYYHYDEDLSYFRLSPAINFYIRKPYPRSPLIQLIKLRAVSVTRELRNNFEGTANSFNNASYNVLNARYVLENTNILRPYTITTDFQLGNNFSKLDVVADFRWMLPNRKWLVWRNFGGLLLNNDFAKQGITPNYYSYGLSGTLDYLFDYEFIGRSDSSGIWSQQMFVTDGGFKSQTGIFADQWMLSSSVNLPIWSVFGVFGDIGFADNFQQVYWDYGGRLSFFTDFLEVYFPFANHQQVFIDQANYAQNIRFILNLDIGAIVGRLRRGYY